MNIQTFMATPIPEIAPEARAAAARTVLAHPSGDMDVIDMLGLGDAL